MGWLIYGKMKSREGTVVDADDLVDDMRTCYNMMNSVRPKTRLNETSNNIISLKLIQKDVIYQKGF